MTRGRRLFLAQFGFMQLLPFDPFSVSFFFSPQFNMEEIYRGVGVGDRNEGVKTKASWVHHHWLVIPLQLPAGTENVLNARILPKLAGEQLNKNKQTNNAPSCRPTDNVEQAHLNMSDPFSVKFSANILSVHFRPRPHYYRYRAHCWRPSAPEEKVVLIFRVIVDLVWLNCVCVSALM